MTSDEASAVGPARWAPTGRPDVFAAAQIGLKGLHSARRADYRVIYRIDGDERQVIVVAIELRSDIYRSRRS